MTKISVIVPVYNTGKYIKRCLDSIVNQTIESEIEIIVINDGSTDDSDERIKEYIRKKDCKAKIKYYSKENEGIAKTRNFGIEKATGDYILFVDSDDYIKSELIEGVLPIIIGCKTSSISYFFANLQIFSISSSEILESKTTFAYKFFLFAISKNLSWIFHCAGMPVALGSLISAEIYSI